MAPAGLVCADRTAWNMKHLTHFQNRSRRRVPKNLRKIRRPLSLGTGGLSEFRVILSRCRMNRTEIWVIGMDLGESCSVVAQLLV